MKLIALLIAMSLSGCATVGHGSFCLTAAPIYVHESDTLSTLTARQILTHNEIGRNLCGW